MKKIRNLMIILMIFLSVGVIGIKNANASDTYSEAFKELTTGTLTLKNSGYDTNAKYDIVTAYIINFNNENNVNFAILGCNENVTSCSIELSDNSEVHDVNIIFDDVYSTTFKKLTGNGKVTVPFLNTNDKQVVLTDYLNTLNTDTYSFTYGTCNEEYTICEIGLYATDEEYEVHVVNINYQEIWSDEFKTLFPNNAFTITSSGYTDKETIINAHFAQFKNIAPYILSCDENYSKCLIALYNNENAITEEHNVNIIYKESYGTQFKHLTSGNLTVKYTYDRGNLINDYINSFNVKNSTHFQVLECNQDLSICTIVLTDAEHRFIEQHAVKVTYEEVLSEQFQKLAPNKTITIKNSDLENIDLLISRYIYLYNEVNNTNFSVQGCNENNTLCKIGLWKDNNYEEHQVNILYKDQYGDIFKKLTKDGNIVVDGSSLSDLRAVVDLYVRRYNTDKYNFYATNCNEDFTKCTISLRQSGEHYNELELHVVNVSFKETFSSDYKKLTSNNQLVIESIEPTTDEEAEFFLSAYVNSFSNKEITFFPASCNDDYTMCDVVMHNMHKGEGGEIHTLKITYKEVNKDIQNKVMEIISSVPKDKKFLLEDLELINYIVNGGYDPYNFDINVERAALNYSTELKQLLGNGNITAKLDIRAGGGDPFETLAFGGFLVQYDGVTYGLLSKGGVHRRHIIYIPDDTEDTPKAYISAAEERINKYLKNKKVKITYGGKSSELNEFFLPELIESGKRKDEYYMLTYEDREIEFLIIKDSSKMQTLESHSTSDIFSDVTISMDASNVPLDTTIKVDKIDEKSEKYKELISKLNLEYGLVYDLKLFSSSLGEYIKELEDGSFEVSIPISENLKDKKLVAYYLKEDGTREEYEIKIVDGKAVFNTNHFSIYTIAEATSVPNTYDGVINYIVLGLVSLIGLVGLTLSLKRKKTN